MEITVNKINDSEQELEISVSANELLPHFEKAYEKARSSIEVKGFRKGKAPISMVKKLYGESIEQDSLDEVTNDLYRKAIDEKNLEPVGQPVLLDVNYRKGEGLRFRVKYDVKPSFQLQSYTGFEVEKPIHPVTDEEVESEIDRLQRINHTTKEVEEVTGEEHIVTADLQELSEAGLPVIGKKTENARLYLADSQLYPQIKDALKQASRGGEYRVRVESSHGDHTHKAFLSVKVNKIEKVELPLFNDDFVKKITKGKIETVDQFRRSLREDIEKFWEEKGERQVFDAIVAEIIKRHDISSPESMVKAILESLLEDIKNQQPNKKLPRDFDVEKFRAENRAYGIWQAKWYLIRERIIEAEGISASDADIEALADREAKTIGIDKDRLVKYYKTSRAGDDKILSEKVLRFLKENVRIKEVVQAATPEL